MNGWKKLGLTALTSAAIIILAGNAAAADITGAGASFPYPVYAKWANEYSKVSGTRLNYQSIGSGGGIKQITAGTVDFGATDMPLKAETLTKDGLTQFPAVMGGVVPVLNLEGVAAGKLHLDGDIISDIYRGKITNWNDRKIVALNPGVKLPAMDITVVYRADSSGTSFVFSSYLAKTSAAFKSEIGAGTSPTWPVGIGGKGNEGVAANVRKVKGSIGYVEYAYAKKNELSYATLKNHDGSFVEPSLRTFAAAAQGADWKSAANFGIDFTNAPGKDSWPITSATFILMHKSQKDADKGREVLKFFDWSYKNGTVSAEALDYVPLPNALVQLVEAAWSTEVKDGTGKAVWP